MFGVEKRVARVRLALVEAFKAKSAQIMTMHADKKLEQIPRHDLARAMVLHDLAEILTNLRVDKQPGEDDA